METNAVIILVLLVLFVSLPGYAVRGQIDDMKARREQQITILQYKDFEKALQCLKDQVPEIDNEWTDYVSDKSEGKAFIDTWIADFVAKDIYRDYEKTEYLGKYYLLYVSEEWEDHSALWAYFYVSEDFEDVLWWDVAMGKDSTYPVLYLDEWRVSDFYPKLNK